MRCPFTKHCGLTCTFTNYGGTSNVPSEYLGDLGIIYYHVREAEHFAIDRLHVQTLTSVDINAFDSDPCGTCYD